MIWNFLELKEEHDFVSRSTTCTKQDKKRSYLDALCVKPKKIKGRVLTIRKDRAIIRLK